MGTSPVVPPAPLDYSTKFGAIRVGKNVNQISGTVGFGVQAPELLSLPAAAAASATFYLNAVSTATGGVIPVNKSPDFCRNVTLVASGSDTDNVVIKGLDANGFPISETLTLNGATPVVGKKAYSWIISVTVIAHAARTISLGTGVLFGFRTRVTKNTLFISLTDQVPDTAGTVVLGSTSSGTDYYGTVSPNTTPNGTHNFDFYFIPTDVNAAGVNN